MNRSAGVGYDSTRIPISLPGLGRRLPDACFEPQNPIRNSNRNRKYNYSHDDAKKVAADILRTGFWLYGYALPKVTITLV
jgi:hypothetical protein